MTSNQSDCCKITEDQFMVISEFFISFVHEFYTMLLHTLYLLSTKNIKFMLNISSKKAIVKER